MSRFNCRPTKTLLPLTLALSSFLGSSFVLADLSDVYRVGIGPVCVEDDQTITVTQTSNNTVVMEMIEEEVSTTRGGKISIMLDNSSSMSGDVRQAARLAINFLKDNTEITVRDLWFVADNADYHKPTSLNNAIGLLDSVGTEEGSPLIEHVARMAMNIKNTVNNKNADPNDDLHAVLFFTDGESDNRGDKPEPPGYYINKVLGVESKKVYGGNRDCWDAYDDGLDWGGDSDGPSLCSKLMSKIIDDAGVQFYFINFGLDKADYSDIDVTQFWNHIVNKTGGQEILSDNFTSSSIDVTLGNLVEKIFNVDMDNLTDTELTENNFYKVSVEPVEFIAAASMTHGLDATRRFHTPEVYLNVLRSNYFTYWPGNLYKYTINANGKLVSANTGFTSPDATKLKDLSSQGGGIEKNILNHGTVSKLSYPRKLLTDPNTPGALVALQASHIPITTPDTPLTSQQVLNWIKNNSIPEKKKTPLFNGSVTSPMEFVNYDYSQNNKKYLFTSRGSGGLHAVNTRNGKEEFVFFPKGYTNELEGLYANRQLAGLLGDGVSEGLVQDMPDGLDGPLSAWVYDKNKDGKIVAPNDHVHLYVTMRSSGKNIYALDVTNIGAPKLKWKIKGGSGSYPKLAETWARVVKTKINIGGNERDVLITTGGYDSQNKFGNAIYIINAANGALLWSASNSGATKTFSAMTKSFPAGVRTVDIDNNGFVDQIYAVDIAGKLWRFDVSNGQTKAKLINGGVIATLGGNGKKFFTTPTVYVTEIDGERKIAIGVGSGDLENPLGKSVNDAAFVVYQDNVDSAPASYQKVTIQNLDPNKFNDHLAKGGWRINLNGTGEKLLAEPTLFNDALLFTTYTPPAVIEPTTKAQCGIIPTNTAKLYLVDITNGKPSGLLTGTTNPPSKYFKALKEVPGVPPTPTILKLKDNKGKAKYVSCVGAHCEKVQATPPSTATFWNVE